MPSASKIQSMLLEGDRRSVGRVPEVIELVREDSTRMHALVDCLRDKHSGVRMRAADALEKISRDQPKFLQIYKVTLLAVLADTIQKEVRWHLAVILPRLQLTAREGLRVSDVLRSYLEDRSSIVKTFAMQGLADLTMQQPALCSLVLDLLRPLTRSGTPAMRARGRKLLEILESERVKQTP